MKTKNLPKVLKFHENANLMSGLCEKFDGNSLIIIYHEINDLIKTYDVLSKENVFKDIVSLLYNEKYTYKKLFNYIRKQMCEVKYDMFFYIKLTQLDKVYLDTMLSLLIRYNKAVDKAIELEKLTLKNTEKYDLYPRYLSYQCVKVNDHIANLNKMQYDQLPIVVKKMKRFDGSFLFDNKEFKIETPKTFKELIYEGYAMHNCLVMRGHDVADERMHVVFIKDENGKSYIDVIMDSNFDLIWAIKDKHVNVSGKDWELVCDWYKKSFGKEVEMAK